MAEQGVNTHRLQHRSDPALGEPARPFSETPSAMRIIRETMYPTRPVSEDVAREQSRRLNEGETG
jgi:hypothetical protein